MDECEMCGGPLEALGALGNRNHYRCRNCGMEFSSESPPPEPNNEDTPRDEHS